MGAWEMVPTERPFGGPYAWLLPQKGVSLLRGLMAGAMWIVAQVHGHHPWDTATCLDCSTPHEDEVHIFWDYVEWGEAQAEWLPSVICATTELRQLGPWTIGLLACLQRTGLFLLSFSMGLSKAPLDKFLYRLYNMYLVVLAACMAAGRKG